MNRRVNLHLLFFVNKIRKLCKDVKNENKALKKSMELLIMEEVVLKESDCYDWAEELTALKTGGSKECLEYHLAGNIVKKPSRFTVMTMLLH